jgi:hypothetical protein
MRVIKLLFEGSSTSNIWYIMWLWEVVIFRTNKWKGEIFQHKTSTRKVWACCSMPRVLVYLEFNRQQVAEYLHHSEHHARGRDLPCWTTPSETIYQRLQSLRQYLLYRWSLKSPRFDSLGCSVSRWGLWQHWFNQLILAQVSLPAVIVQIAHCSIFD